MKMKMLLLLLNLLAFSVAEQFVKVKGTSGEFSDIVVNSKGRWYINHYNHLCTSTNKGAKRETIELPSEQSILTGFGLDKDDKLYVQDSNLKVFRVVRSESGNFEFEEIKLIYDNERLVSRPFTLKEDNKVFFASKSGLMSMVHHYKSTESDIYYPFNSEFTQLTHFEYWTEYHSNREDFYYSGGGNRQWIYRKYGMREIPVWQTASTMKRMNAVNDLLYFAVNGVNEIYVIKIDDEIDVKIPSAIEGIDASNINAESDFVIHSPKHGNKTYIYMNVEEKGTIYGLNEKQGVDNSVVEVISTHRLDNVNAKFKCAVFDDDGIYFGTSDGVYKLIDIQPIKHVKKE